MKLSIAIIFALTVGLLMGQNALQINGINEAQFVYRTAPDSLNTYFSNSFGFNLRYQDFRFGMKFNSELPKYSNEQTELMQQLDPARLSVKWEELYAGFSRDDFSIHVGTTEETFGNGIVFRSFEDIEFDDDHRLQSALFRYDAKLKLKAIYGAINNPANISRYDLAYGLDAEYPVLRGIRLGASAMAFRDLTPLNRYSFRDVFAGRMSLSLGNLDAFSEYAAGKVFQRGGSASEAIQAVFANAEYHWANLLVGASYKNYDGFDYRLNDIPLANYHGETLSDALGSGQDEEGWQARASYHLGDSIYLRADYAEAWDSSKAKQMNDLYLSLEYSGAANTYLASWNHIEKVDDTAQTWQKEYYPALGADIRKLPLPLYLQAEFKTVEKQNGAVSSSHYEPLLQADFRLRKLSVSLGVQSWWADFDTISSSKYNPNIELKYPVFEHSDLILFAGKEQGGKVCRNGMCRFVAPFEGVRAEFITRF